ncbi:MAG: HAD hydrolase-like protein [Rickettsiales bacterium]|jgi:HAD superfamily hydrolase (TIGR01450 family)|nr:HAD hydrolase-like protein [Rickettsiales bacterium]
MFFTVAMFFIFFGTARAETVVHDNLSKIWDGADVIILDAYGVFWSGKSFFENSRDLMRDAVRSGKMVYVLSNATQLSWETAESYRRKEGGGIIPSVHYHHLVTSGDFTRSILREGKLKFKNNANPKYVYQMGVPNLTLFEGTKYVIVDAMEKADFIYLGPPKLTEEQYNAYPHREQLRESPLEFHGNSARTWDSLVVDPFMADLRKAKKLGLPILSANPDLTVEQVVRGTSERVLVVRQGMVAQAYRKIGGEVVEFGKPDRGVFNIILEDLRNRGIEVERDRIIMVGDTIGTDIAGANGAGIKSCLCTETGVTASILNEKLRRKTDKLMKKRMSLADRDRAIMALRVSLLEELLKKEKARADYLIRGLSVNYRSQR